AGDRLSGRHVGQRQRERGRPGHGRMGCDGPAQLDLRRGFRLRPAAGNQADRNSQNKPPCRDAPQAATAREWKAHVHRMRTASADGGNMWKYMLITMGMNTIEL